VNEKYIALAIPFFFVAIAVELGISQRRARDRFRFADSITNLSCGVGQQVLAPFFKTATLAGYIWLYEHARVLTIAPTFVAWTILLLGVDAAYYFFHRATHRINLLWAGHVVHHQSEEYNLTVALRQSWFVKLVEWMFYLPLAIAGFSPEMFLVMTTLNTLYQFWIHTRAVGKLGPLEWFMNTPSHHRVHHGIDPKYIDKNYGGILIIWDRMFGTFREEDTEPVYGIVHPLSSWNPLWANVHYLADIWRMARESDRMVDRIAFVFAPPEWRPKSMGGNVVIPDVSRATQTKYDAHGTRGVAAYVTVGFGLVAIATTGMLWVQAQSSLADLAIVASIILATLIGFGALFEMKRWAVPFEIVRLACAAAAIAWLSRGAEHGTGIAIAAIAGAMTFAAWVLRFRHASAAPREAIA
jgi:sterol desaturase/sphingolipid hydroxylase (fatty acid hydroxylase superfamily)